MEQEHAICRERNVNSHDDNNLLMIKSMAEQIVSNFVWMKRKYFHFKATKELRVNKKLYSNGNMMKMLERSLTKYNPILLVCLYRYNRCYSFRTQYCDCLCDFYYNIICIMYNAYMFYLHYTYAKANPMHHSIIIIT